MNFEKINSKDIMKKIKIPEWELDLSFTRSSGPGGQRGNKVSTKAVLRFDVGSSKTLNDEQKEVVSKKLANRINEKGEIVLSDETTRSQWQNRANVIRRLNEIINDVLIPEKERIPTKVSKGAKERRLEEKKERGRIKESRKKVELE